MSIASMFLDSHRGSAELSGGEIEHMNNEGLASVVVDRMGNKVDITPVVGEGRGWHPAKLRPSSEVSAMVNHEAGWLYVCKNY